MSDMARSGAPEAIRLSGLSSFFYAMAFTHLVSMLAGAAMGAFGLYAVLKPLGSGWVCLVLGLGLLPSLFLLLLGDRAAQRSQRQREALARAMTTYGTFPRSRQ